MRRLRTPAAKRFISFEPLLADLGNLDNVFPTHICNGVDGGTEFLKSVERLQKEFSDVQVAANVHSFLNSYPYPNNMGLLEMRDVKAKNPNGPNPFINNALWKQWLVDAHSGALKYIAEEKAKAEKKGSN